MCVYKIILNIEVCAINDNFLNFSRRKVIFLSESKRLQLKKHS